MLVSGSKFAGRSSSSTSVFLSAAAFFLVAFFFALDPEALATTVKLGWAPHTDQTLAGYRIHYGGSSRSYSTVIDVKTQTTCTVGNLRTGQTYYFAATAYDIYGNESDYSNEVAYTVPNLPPVAQDGTLSGTEDLPVSGVLRAADPESQPLTFRIVTPPARGSVTLTDASTGAFVYSPKRDVNGVDAFTYKAGDGVQQSNEARIVINIAPVNDPPVAVADQAVTTASTAVTISVLANDGDVDGDAIAIGSVTQGKNGATAIVGTSVRYTPKAGFSGTDTFSYVVSDGKGGTASATVTVQVLAANRPPVASPVSLSAKAGATVSGKLLGSDPDGDPLRYTLVSQPTKGKVTLVNASDGSFTYSAGSAAVGGDSFSYKADDGKTDSNIATVTVNLSGAGRVLTAINAGGPRFVDSRGIVFEADGFFAGGNVYATGAAIADTVDDALYQTERWGTFSYGIPVPNGHYLVTLKLAEIYWNEGGRRVFDIGIEGREVVSDLDIAAHAGRARAYDLQIPVRVVDGTLNIAFRADKDQAKLSGLVVQEWGEAFSWGVNAGGGRYVDTAGRTFEGDMLFSGGRSYGTAALIAGTEDARLYQTERYGDFSYDIPLPNGTYEVILKLAEIYWNQPGKRIFDLKIEGESVLSGFDILSLVGKNEIYDYPVFVHVTDGVLNLGFQTRADHAKVSGILLRRVP